MSNEGVIAGYVDRIWRKYRAKRGVQTAGMNCKTRSNETLWLHLSRVSILPLAFLDFSGNYGIILILCGDVQDGKAVKVHIALELMLYFVWKFHRDPPPSRAGLSTTLSYGAAPFRRTGWGWPRSRVLGKEANSDIACSHVSV